MQQLRYKGQYYIKPFSKSSFAGLKLMILTTLTGAIIQFLYTPPEKPLSPLGETQVQAVEAPVVSPTAGMNEDALIDYYATKYTSNPSTQAHRKALLHCLYWKETRGGVDADAHGDNGKAGGPFQFWADTYKSMRSRMIKEGVATEMGSRENFENAVDTTSWAISQGMGSQWGPLLRGECK